MSLTAAEDTHIYLYDAEQDSFSKSAVLWRSGVRKLAASQAQHAGLIDQVRRSGRPIVNELTRWSMSRIRRRKQQNGASNRQPVFSVVKKSNCFLIDKALKEN